ncbi:MAG TPA: TIGR04013 family B12-binding domain/radical SAM domain-containing protein [Candidatus Omnitrophota bacterium]|nr:TIGR04013 family B12-binding domain/radical SAM domain-containing protein [Candidatus Omnitrophota bacterium]HPS20761.1 TIGR04013 family B12-binding domain/radical SAM domain-containing protein [Candidatus Omnitrophota bacterium]
MHNNKTKILFRWSGKNMYTLAVLIGLLDDALSEEKFHIGTIEDLNDIGEHLKDGSRVVIAYSFSTPEKDIVKKEIADIRTAYGKKVTLIAGGPHATARTDETLSFGFDTVFTGESEVSLPDFLMKFNDDPSYARPIVPPLPMNNFDDYPPFAYKRDFFAPVEIRRGCLIGCKFCQTSKIFPCIRERSVSYVKKYMEYIKTSKRYNAFFLTPDALSYGSKNGKIDPSGLERFLSGVRSTRVNIHLGNFPSEISPRSLAQNPECADILKKYVSNTKIIVGGQSGSDKVLRSMGRGHSSDDISSAVKHLTRTGFTPIVDILFGTPGETRHDRNTTIKFMNELYEKYHSTFNIHYFTPLPGTDFEHDLCEKIESDILNDISSLIRHGIAHQYA